MNVTWAVNGGLSRSSGSIDATNLPEGMLMGLGPTRGAGFPGVTACTLLLGITGTVCSCTFSTVSATSRAVDMVPVSAVLGDSEFCHGCSDSRMNCSTVDSGFWESDFTLTARGLLANATRCVVDLATGFRCGGPVFGSPGVLLVVCGEFFGWGLS